MVQKRVREREVTSLAPVYFLLIAVMFLLPYWSWPGYSLLRHTTSQLGAQGAPHGWIMNLVFVLLGVSCLWEATRSLQDAPICQVLLSAFAFSLILTALFRHAPLDQTLSYRIWEDQVHSVSATAVGFSFTLFAVSAAFVEERINRKIAAAGIGLLAIGLSLLMVYQPQLRGVWQRGMFLASFGWLLIFLDGRQKEFH